MLLIMGIFIQIKTINEATNSVGTSIRDNSGLKDELISRKSQYEQLYETLEGKEEELEKVRQNASATNDSDAQNEIIIKNNKTLLGLTEITGQGVAITLDENRKVNSSEVINISDYLVHEGDLLYIVNELFNSGADAISINDQRITSQTSIICDGNIIRVNGKMVGVPIVIKAIGYPERMYYALARPGGYLQMMADDGIEVYIKKTENDEKITIPKYDGVYNYEFLVRGDV